MGKLKKKKINKMKSLPEDVIISILAKLQVKPLMRFRCVCKSWYDLIKSPNFIEMHQSSTENNKNECILIKHASNDDDVTELSYHSYESLNEFLPRLEVPYFKRTRIDVSWPCNGLLFCIGYDYEHSVSFLCNPATREFKLLPPCPFLSSDLYIGLGFDSIRKDYKIVILTYMKKHQIYNLSSDSWRSIEDDMSTVEFTCHSSVQAVPFNGALHWFAQRDEIDIILSLDVSTEVFQDINLPQVIAHSNNQSVKNLTLINDSLAMFTFTYDSSLQKFVDIWVMKEGSWMKQISFGGFVTDEFIIPCLLWKNDTILINTSTSPKLKLWALYTHELIDAEIYSCEYVQQVMIYKESLVSIKWER